MPIYIPLLPPLVLPSSELTLICTESDYPAILLFLHRNPFRVNDTVFLGVDLCRSLSVDAAQHRSFNYLHIVRGCDGGAVSFIAQCYNICRLASHYTVCRGSVRDRVRVCVCVLCVSCVCPVCALRVSCVCPVCVLGRLSRGCPVVVPWLSRG